MANNAACEILPLILNIQFPSATFSGKIEYAPREEVLVLLHFKESFMSQKEPIRHLEIYLLGGFQLIYRGERLTRYFSPRNETLLAYLLLHQNQQIPRQQIAYTFWPNSSDKQARTNLRRELHELQQRWPKIEQFLDVSNRFVGWRADADFSLDVTCFEQLVNENIDDQDAASRHVSLEDAIKLYAGDLLPICYDEWILPFQENLRQAFLKSLLQLVMLHIEARDYEEAISITQRLLQVDPLDETNYQRLMELYAISGKRPQALHTFHTCATVLERELGVPPSDETQAIYQQLQQLEERMQPPELAVTGSIKLVGRLLEWQTLLSAWRSASKGIPHFILIEGEAGIGKTRLAEELVEWVNHQGGAVARTRSYAAEGSLAYAPVIEILRSDALQPALNDLDQVWLAELARLLPELAIEQAIEQAATSSLLRPISDQQRRQRLFEGAARAVTYASQPLLLLLDDLQWCDQETLEWLRFLLRFDVSASLLIVGTARSEEVVPEHPLVALTTELRVHHQMTKIELSPLSEAESAALALQEEGTKLDREALARIYQRAEGNPLFVVEMVRAGSYAELSADLPIRVDEINLPPKVYAVIQHRLTQLSPTARAIVSVAAIIGRSFSFEVLTAATEKNENEVAYALDELWQRRIIREQSTGSYDFGHDRIREAAYAELSPIRRRLLHRNVANGIEEVYAHDLKSVSAQLARHHKATGNPETACFWYRESASHLSARFAWTDAIEQLEAALEQLALLPADDQRLTDEIEIMIALIANYEVVEGFYSPVIKRIQHQLGELLPRIKEIHLRYAMLLEVASHHLDDETIRHANELTLLAEELGDSAKQAEAYRCAGMTTLRYGDFQSSQNYYQKGLLPYQAQSESEKIELDRPELLLYLQHSITLWFLGYLDQSYAIINDSLSVQHNHYNPFVESIIHFWIALNCRHYREPLKIRFQSQRMMEIGEMYNMPVSLASGYNSRGSIRFAEGDIDGGLQDMRLGIDQFHAIRHTMFQTHRLGFLAEAQLSVGRPSEGLQTIEEAFEMSEKSGQRSWDAELHRLHGEILLALGKSTDEAVEACYQRALDTAEKQSAQIFTLRSTMSLSRFYAQQGRASEAHQQLQAAYDWFTEGFDTKDLVEARELLQKLVE